MKLKCTEVFEDNWSAIHELDENGQRKYRYIINEGSSRSSKTYSLIDCFDIYARSNKNKRLTAWRETKKDCKDTLLNDFLKHLRDTDRYTPANYNKTESIYKYSNGSQIEARGTDEEGVFGLTQNAAWLNEPYSISKDILDQIDQRTSDFIFIDWNPKQNHWIDDLKKNSRTIVIHSTFLKNPFCPEESRIKLLSYEPLPHDLKYLKDEPIEKVPKEYHNAWNNEQIGTANLYNWQVYGLGIKGEVEGKVFDNYKEIDEVPIDAELYGSGFDYGYSQDPSTIIRLYEWKSKSTINKKAVILDEMVYSRGLQPTALHLAMLDAGLKFNELIIGDRTAQLMMDELFDRGWVNIHAAKGNNSVDYGISKMKDMDIYITKRSVNLIYEFDNYKNAKDKYGKYINAAEKGQMEHGIDGSRYIITDLVTAPEIFTV